MIKYVMKKNCCIKCNKYRKLKNSNVSYIFNETLVLSITCRKRGSNKATIFKKEESIAILKIVSLIGNVNK